MSKTFEEWAEKYPKHCVECFGLGVVHWTENHGDNLHEPMEDFCICVYDDTCSRCGGKLDLDADAFEDAIGREALGTHSCGHCGWDWNAGINDSFWPDEEEFDIDF